MSDIDTHQKFAEGLTDAISEYLNDFRDEYGEDSIAEVDLFGVLEAYKLGMAYGFFETYEDDDEDFRIGGPLE